MTDWANLAATAIVGVVAAAIAGIELMRARLERMQGDREALVALHSDLTSRDVFAARMDVLAGKALLEAEKRALVSLVERSAERLVYLNRQSVGGNGLVRAIYRGDDTTRSRLSSVVLAELVRLAQAVDPERTSLAWSRIDEAEVSVEALAERTADATENTSERDGMPASRADRSRYRWGASSDPLSKHEVLQRIAIAMTESDEPLTPDDPVASAGEAPGSERELLERRLEHHVRMATGRSPDAGGDKMLLPLAKATDKNQHKRIADNVGPVQLDGGEYVVRHQLGLPAAGYGTRTQIPVIDYFAKLDPARFPIERL